MSVNKTVVRIVKKKKSLRIPPPLTFRLAAKPVEKKIQWALRQKYSFLTSNHSIERSKLNKPVEKDGRSAWQ